MKRFILVILTSVLFLGSFYAFASDLTDSGNIYGKLDKMVNYVRLLTSSTVTLKGTAADTSASFDLHYFKEAVIVLRIHEHDADTANVTVHFEVSNDATNWIFADSVADVRTADSTFFSKDLSFPAGFLYGRFIYTGVQNAVDTSRVDNITISLQQ